LIREALAAREAVSSCHRSTLLLPRMTTAQLCGLCSPRPAGRLSSLQWCPLSSDQDGRNTAFHIAAVCGNAGAVTALLTAGAEVDVVDAGGCRPLWLASQDGRTDVVNVLLAAGAAVSLTNSEN